MGINTSKLQTRKILLALPILFVMIAIILKPTRYIESASCGLVIFSTSVLPSLFPFFFFTKLLTSIGMAESIGNILRRPMEKLYHAPSITGYIWTMSLLSGYPIGAKLTSDLCLEGVITKEDAKRIISMTSMSGPLFVIGTVGAGILGVEKYGYIILVSIILSSLLNGLIYRGKKEIKNEQKQLFRPLNQDNLLNDAINSSIISILAVGGYIVIFYILADVLTDIGVLKMISNILQNATQYLSIDSKIYDGISVSLIEMTKGIMIMANSSQIMAKIPIITGLIAFGGLSITIQSITYLSLIKIKVSYYLMTKLTQAILATLIAYILMLIFV